MNAVIEVYCACSLKVCEERDTKGLYRKARAGEIREFTGISAPYEEPPRPEIRIDTDRLSIQESAAAVIEYLKSRKILE